MMGRRKTIKAQERKNRSAPDQNRTTKKRRHKSSRALYYILLSMFLLAVGIALSLTVLFPIQDIQVEGCDSYPPEKVVNTSGIMLGENLFRIDLDQARQNLLQAFADFKEVKISRNLPNKITIHVEMELPAAAIVQNIDDETYTILAQSGKILAVDTTERPEQAALLCGFSLPEAVAVGDYILPEDSESMVLFDYLQQAIAATGFTDITYIDLSDPYNIILVWQERIAIYLGSEADLEYKLTFCRRVAEEQLPENFEGLLDATISNEVRSRPMDIDELLHPDEEQEETPDATQPQQPDADDPTQQEDDTGSDASGQAAEPDDAQDDALV